jgi:hypothetical protein
MMSRSHAKEPAINGLITQSTLAFYPGFTAIERVKTERFLCRFVTSQAALKFDK